MSKALERINKIALKGQSKWLDEAKERASKAEWRDKSVKIAICVLREIRKQKETNGMTQKKLAEEMDVSAQYINKVVKGQENLTLETISKLEGVLGITLFEIPSFAFNKKVQYHPIVISLTKQDTKMIAEQSITYSNNQDYHAECLTSNLFDGTNG